jgi:hypothetical protein
VDLILPSSGWVSLILSCIRLHSWGLDCRERGWKDCGRRRRSLTCCKHRCWADTDHNAERKRDGNVPRLAYGNGRTAKIPTDAFCKLERIGTQQRCLLLLRLRHRSCEIVLESALRRMHAADNGRRPTAMLALLDTFSMQSFAC